MREPNFEDFEFVASTSDGESMVLSVIKVVQEGDKYYAITVRKDIADDSDQPLEVYVFVIKHFDDEDHNDEDFTLEFVNDEKLVNRLIEKYSEDIENSINEDDEEEDELFHFTIEDQDGEEHHFIVWDTFVYIDRKFHVCYEVPEDFDEEDIVDFEPESCCFLEVIGWDGEESDMEVDKDWIFVEDEVLAEELDSYYCEMYGEDDDE